MSNPVGSSIKDSVNSYLDGIMSDLYEKMKELANHAMEQIQSGANIFLKEMLDFVLYTPTLANDPIIEKLWNIVRTISFSLIGLMFVWEGFKKGVSSDLIRTVEFKQMFVRMIYGLVLSVFSLDLIDIIIRFNEALVTTMKDNFTIQLDSGLQSTGVFSSIMILALLVVQVVIGIRLILQYWMRIAELWFMAIIGPIMYTLWINPNWSGYLGQWFRRLTSTVFTTFAWSIIIAIYSAMISMIASAGMMVGFPTLGPIAGMCLSIALLLVMVETPSFLRQFIDSHQSAVTLAKANITQAVKAAKAIRSLNVKGKVAGWMVKR